MKKLLSTLCISLCLSALLSASETMPWTPNKFGTLIGPDGKPTFLVGSITSRYSIALSRKKGKNFRGLYPDKYRFFYEGLPVRDTLEKMGFNSIVWESSPTALNVLLPDYKENKDKDPFDAYQTGIKKYSLKHSKRMWSRSPYNGMHESIRSYRDFPGFVSAGFQCLTKYHNEMKNILDPQKILVHKGKGLRDIPVQLGSPEAVKMLAKYYAAQAEESKKLGVTPIGYRIFCESRYHDYSAANQKRFVKRLKKKFGTVENMNKAWHVHYKSFKDAAKTNTNRKFRTVPACVEYSIMEQEQANKIGTTLNNVIKQVQPESGAVIQILGNAHYRSNITNFHLNTMSKDLEYISTGTGNYHFSSLENVSDSVLFKDAPSISEHLAEAPVREAFYHAIAKDRPLVNLEAYCAGPHYNAQNFSAVLWRELATGHCAVMFHSLSGLQADPANKHPVSYYIQNPNAVPPEEYQGIRDMRENSKDLLDFFADRKTRPKAEIGFIFSQPTMIYDFFVKKGLMNYLPKLTAAVYFQHYPMDAILEEEIGTIDLKSKYKIIFAQGVKCTYPQTNELIKKYVTGGGILIAEGALMQCNEHGFKRQYPVITDIQIKKNKGAKIGSVKGSGIKAAPSTYLELGKGWESIANVDGRTILASRTMGKGKIYVVAGEMQDYARAELLKKILKQSRAKKTAQVLHPKRNEEIPNIEIIKMQKGDLTCWYIANMNCYPKLIRIKSASIKGSKAINPLDKEAYNVAADGTVTLLIPSAKRFVLITGPDGKVEKRFGTMPKKSIKQLRSNYKKQLEELKNSSEFCRPSTPINITEFANAGFDNQQRYTVDTAFIEDGKRELKDLPFHESTFGDLKFDVIRFDFNENKTCIALHSKEVKGISLNGRLASIAFLVVGTHVKDGDKALTLRFNYQDGSSIEQVLTAGKDFGSWLANKNSKELNKRAVWKNTRGNVMFQYEWYNPEAAKPLKSLDLISGNGETVPIVCAISTRASQYKKAYKNRIELSKIFTRVEKENMYWKDRIVTSPSGFAWIFAPKGDHVGVDVSKLNVENAVVRYSVSRLPDKYGNIQPFKRLGMGFRGLIDGKKVTFHPRAWTQTGEGISPSVANQKNSLAWYEVEWPLKGMLRAKETDKKMQNLMSMMFFAPPSTCPLRIRYLRIEYDD